MGNASVQIRANNGQYVCAENSGGGLIVANRNAPFEWESFVLVNTQGTPLQDGSLVALECNNGQFVCAENSGGSSVVANRDSIGPWETFTIKRVDGRGSIQSGDRVAFLCNDGRHYLCAEGGGGSELVANRSVIGPWETFVITLLPPRHVRIEIKSIYCDNTEDVTGADELYFIGSGVSRSDKQITAVLTTPIKINDRQTKNLPPDQSIVFDGTVECADTIVIGLKAYDQDASGDWNGKRGELLSNISSAVSVGLATTGPQGVVAGAVVKGAVEAFKLLVSLDKDDELGVWEVAIPVVTLPLPRSERTWNFARKGGIGLSTWDYTVTFLISVN